MIKYTLNLLCELHSWPNIQRISTKAKLLPQKYLLFLTLLYMSYLMNELYTERGGEGGLKAIGPKPKVM